MIQDDGFWSTERLLPPKKRGATPSDGVLLTRLPSAVEDAVITRRSYPSLRSLYSASVSASGVCSSAGKDVSAAKEQEEQTGDASQPYCSYFSYAPCFGELNRKQRNTYFCIRAEFQKQRRVRVDYSYLVLYLYEQLNGLNAANARQTLDHFLWIWKQYRGDFAVLDKLFSDWVTDLCVEWALPFPLAELDGILSGMVRPSSPVLHTVYLFDYLLSGERCPRGAQIEYVMNALCDYRYRTVARYRDNALYAASMDGFLAHLFQEGFLTRSDQRDEFLSLKIPTRITLKRSSYPGAILDGSRRRMLCYEYCPLLGDRNVKSRFTSLIKYVDNRIRRRLGWKIKFSSVSIAPVHQRFIDLHFEAYFSTRSDPPADSQRGSGASPVKRSLQVDLQRAAAIESESWRTTDALTEELYREEETVVAGREEEPVPHRTSSENYCYTESTEEDVTELCASLDPLETEFTARLLYTSLEEVKSFCRAKGQLLDHLVRRVNAKALELLGDVVIESSGRVIEDYREPMEFLLPKDQYLPFQA